MDAVEFFYHDTSIVVHCGDSEKRFRSVVNKLKRAGYAVTTCPRIDRDYPILKKYHRYITRDTPSGMFECSSQFYPRGFKFECYQNVVTENRHGGMYDFGKLSKMPFLIRMRFLHFRNIVSNSLLKLGVAFRPGSSGDTPIDRFNDSWTPGRFVRGDDGWPADSELNLWNRKTADGVTIQQGMRAYSLSRNKRWITGRLYGGINGMWMMYVGNRMVENHNARHYYASPAKVTKGRVPMDSDSESFKKHFERAIVNRDYKAMRKLLAKAESLCV